DLTTVARVSFAASATSSNAFSSQESTLNSASTVSLTGASTGAVCDGGFPHRAGTETGSGAGYSRPMLLVQVILASTRDGRFSERAGRWVREHLEARADMDVELVDLRDYPLPFFDGVAPA